MYDDLLDSFTEDETAVVHHALQRARPGVGRGLLTTFTPGEKRAIDKIAGWTLAGYVLDRTVISKCVGALKAQVPVELNEGEREVADALLREMGRREHQRAVEGERVAREAAAGTARAVAAARAMPAPTPVQVSLGELVKVVADAVRTGIEMGKEAQAPRPAAGYVVAWRGPGGEPTQNAATVYPTAEAADRSRVTYGNLHGHVPVVYALVPVSGDPTP